MSLRQPRRTNVAIAGLASLALFGGFGSAVTGGCTSQGTPCVADLCYESRGDSAPRGNDDAGVLDAAASAIEPGRVSPVSQAIVVNQTNLAIRLCPLFDGFLIQDFPEATGGLKKPPFPASRIMPQSNRLGIEPGGAAYISDALSSDAAGDYVRDDFRRGNGVAVIDQAEVSRGAVCTEILVQAAVKKNGLVAYPTNADAAGIYVLSQKDGKFRMTWTPVVSFTRGDNELRVRYVGEIIKNESLRLSVGEGGNVKSFAEGAFRGGDEVALANEGFVDSQLSLRNFEISTDRSNIAFSQGMVQTAALYDPTISPSVYFGQKVTYAALMVDVPQKHLLVLPLRNPGVPVKEPMEDAGADAGDARN
jgi:hypothetical protein